MMVPLSRERLDEYLQRDEQEVRSPAKARPPRQMVTAETTTRETKEEQEAVSPADRSADRSAERSAEIPAAKEDSHTLVEGVRAVSKTMAMEPVGGLSEDTEAAQGKSDKLEAVEAAPVNPGPRGRTKRTGRLVLGTVVTVAAAIGFLSWIHGQDRVDEVAAATNVELPEPRVIDIEEGPFRRGLDDESQSFIMQLCHRMHREPGDNCERDRLLDGEFPRQTVRMPAYGIDSGPVRNMDYQQCVDAGECAAISFDDCHIWTPQGRQIGVRMPRALLREERPVVCVNQAEARQYCRWKDGDLPTHNQWEKAARGRDGDLFPWGGFWEADLANWGEQNIMRASVAGKLDGYPWTSPPGAFPDGRSPYGLDDMAGNVAEWIRGDDELEGYVRGGSWISTPFEMRTTARQARDVESRRTDIGFRCVY